jgi:hypothetical protein
MKPEIVRFSHLSPARQALVRLCQRVNYGQIRGIGVRDAEPLFDSGAVAVVAAKLNREEPPRAELKLSDFDLRDEVWRLMARLDEFKNGVIERIDVRAGLPWRMVFGSRLVETPGVGFSQPDIAESVLKSK